MRRNTWKRWGWGFISFGLLLLALATLTPKSTHISPASDIAFLVAILAAVLGEAGFFCLVASNRPSPVRFPVWEIAFVGRRLIRVSRRCTRAVGLLIPRQRTLNLIMSAAVMLTVLLLLYVVAYYATIAPKYTLVVIPTGAQVAVPHPSYGSLEMLAPVFNPMHHLDKRWRPNVWATKLFRKPPLPWSWRTCIS